MSIETPYPAIDQAQMFAPANLSLPSPKENRAVMIKAKALAELVARLQDPEWQAVFRETLLKRAGRYSLVSPGAAIWQGEAGQPHRELAGPSTLPSLNPQPHVES